ncbi:MAG: hypothetical protein ACLTTO_02785 [Lachnospiraceae bacterium]
MQERYISSGSSRLHIAVWEPSGERKAIMQISHGMIEYIKSSTVILRITSIRQESW